MFAVQELATRHRTWHENIQAYELLVSFETFETDMAEHIISLREIAAKFQDKILMVLSPEFVARKWPMKELLCFLKRREEAASSSDRYPIVIPLFYRLSISDLYQEPQLGRRRTLFESSRFFERWEGGDPEADTATIQRALRSLHMIQGVRNDDGATNSNHHVMYTRRKTLLTSTTDKIVQALSEAERRSV